VFSIQIGYFWVWDFLGQYDVIRCC